MTVTVAAGSVDELAKIVARTGATRVLLFTGGSSYTSSGAAGVVDIALSDLEVTTISDVAPNPSIDAVEHGIRVVGDASPDLIVAVGGGSVIDLAKSVRMLAPQDVGARQIVMGAGAGIERRGQPLVAIPTTAGTGSEVTHFAVVYVDGIKHSLAHEWVRPDHAIVDPELTYSLPPHITAATGLDALSQAIESFWSVHSTDESTAYADRAMRLAFSNLADAVHRPSPESRGAMSEASTSAGKAIDITTTTAPHALSYILTSEFGVPHGNAVAITLGAVLEFNAAVGWEDCVDPRGPAHVVARMGTIVDMLGATSPVEARLQIEALVVDLGLPSNLTAIGAGATSDRSRIARAVNVERLSGNPRSFSTDQLRALVDSLG
jgi:alcohol dehydrogenase class IV